MSKVAIEDLIKQAEIEEALAKSLDFEWGGCPTTAHDCKIRAMALRELAEELRAKS